MKKVYFKKCGYAKHRAEQRQPTRGGLVLKKRGSNFRD